MLAVIQETFMRNAVTTVAAAPPEVAVRHFEEVLTFETDCWDTH